MLRRLFRSKNLSVMKSGKPKRASIVTFESVVVAFRDVKHSPFAYPLAEKYGISILHVVPNGADWYQYLEMPEVLDTIRDHLRPDAFAYGSSMGGYGAIRFADDLGLSRALALAPQFSIDPERVPFERRWQDHSARIDFLHETPRIRSARASVVVDSTHAGDMAHAGLIAAEGPTDMISVPYGGHPPGGVLLELGLLSTIFEAFLHGTENIPQINDLIFEKVKEQTSPSMLVNQAKRLKGRRRLTILERAHEADPTHRRAAFQFGIELLRKGQHHQAEKVLPVALSNKRYRKDYCSECAALGIEPVLVQEWAESETQVGTQKPVSPKTA